MNLATYRIDDAVEIGLVTNGIVSLTKRLPREPRNLIDVIAAWSTLRNEIIALVAQPPDFAFDEVSLLAPISRPGKILGIGLNYADHIQETGLAKPDSQLWFMKPPTAVNGPFSSIPLPRASVELDYEAELVAVIGERCRLADREQAARAIFGYCAGNDVSVRDWQFKTSQFTLGKAFDGHAVHGPWIVTKDAIDISALAIKCWVNDDLRQNSNTSHLIFDPISQVEYLSQVMTLEPGDLIYTGTPGGVGMGRVPPEWLKAGDRVRIQIENIGSIENIVHPEQTP